MSQPVMSITADLSALEASEIMATKQVKRLPVVTAIFFTKTLSSS